MTGSLITDTPCSDNTPDTIMLDKAIEGAYWVDVATPNENNLHSTVTGKLQKYRGLKEELVRMWQLKTVCIVPSVLSTDGIITDSS
jgi:hypothetical protein